MSVAPVGLSRDRLARLVGFSLSGIGVIWLGFLIWQDIPDVIDSLGESSPSWVLLSVVLLSFSLVPSVFVFGEILNGIGVRSLDRRDTARLLLVGQVVRYLPGRFWGVAYQVNAARSAVPAALMLRVNIDYMVMSLGVNVTVGLVLWSLASGRWAVTAFILPVGLGVTALALAKGWVASGVRALERVTPAKLGDFARQLSHTSDYNLARISRIFWLRLIGWTLYLGAWLSLGEAFPILHETDVVLICGVYTVAWAVGFVTLLTPGGLGVRELVFYALLPDQVGSAAVAFVAVFVRFWLMVSELGLGLLAGVFLRRPRSSR